MPGQRVAVALTFEPGLGATSFRFDFNGGSSSTIAVSASATSASANLTLPANATEARLNIVSARTGAADFNLN